MTLDLRKGEGQAVLRDLVRYCDVLVENFRLGTLEKGNLSPENLREVNPRLIMVRASAFGQTGPFARNGGLDRIGLAMGGVSSLG